MDNNKEIAIKISGVKKKYKLGQIGGGSLQADLQSWWAKVRNKEDPNTKIGQEERLVGQTFMALNGIDLTIYKGEAVGIIGSNGAGKSTLLKLLSRVTAPTEGEIDIYGRIASMLEVGTGFNPEMTGRENVYMNGAILGMTKAEIDDKMEQIIEFSEVGDFIDTPVKRYSSGMYVKLAFSVSAHLDSEIMIMDEVLAVGDMAFQKKCLKKMRDAATLQGKTVLYVSHNMNTIRQLCNRCIVLDKGKVIYEGYTETAITYYLNSESNDDIAINYANISRLNWLENTKVKTLMAKYIGKDSNVFESCETMVIGLEWLNEKNIENLCLRVEFLNPDRTPITTALLTDFYSGKKDEKNYIEIGLKLNQLSSGRYTMNYVFFEKDDMGNNNDIDCVHGLYFEVIRKDEIIKWNRKAWGSIISDEILLKEMR